MRRILKSGQGVQSKTLENDQVGLNIHTQRIRVGTKTDCQHQTHKKHKKKPS